VVPQSTTGEHPRFSFKHADVHCRDAWAFKPGLLAADIFTFICEVSQSTWGEIENQETGTGRRKKRHHSYSVDGLCERARDRFGERHYDELFDPEVVRFRLDGKQRLWGVREGAVFHVIWWDPEHKVCPTDRD
jgi:hypothetical protein